MKNFAEEPPSLPPQIGPVHFLRCAEQSIHPEQGQPHGSPRTHVLQKKRLPCL